jgi:hypothetical protein
MPKRNYKHDKATDPTFAQANALATEFWKRAYQAIADQRLEDASSVHSCSAGCGKPQCVARRRMEALERAGDELWELAKTSDTLAHKHRRKVLKDWLTLRQKK